jgi:ferrochelatase
MPRAALSAGAPTGVLLVNLGTPEAPTRVAVRRYLREFLCDPRVIDLPTVPRWLLVHLVVAPIRGGRSAEAYRKVWLPEGSPLAARSRELAEAVARELGGDHVVALGMRYGRPSIASALDAILARGARRVVVAPLYPHHASASTGSALQETFRVAARRAVVPALEVVGAFHADDGYLGACLEVARETLASARPDHVVFSFHGLPVRQVARASRETGGACFSAPSCCDELGPGNDRCYRAQCHATARRLADALGWSEDSWSVAFQSRFGRDTWLGPAFDDTIRRLAVAGVRRLAVWCPGFVADCLETVEEIGMRGRDAFVAAGGEALSLVPALNAHPAWVRALAALVRRP